MAQMPLIIGRFFGRFFNSISSIRNYQKALDAARRSLLMADGLRNDFQAKGSLRVPEKNNSTSGGLLARLLRYIHRHVSRYAPLDVPCRRTQIRRNLVELFLTVTLIHPHKPIGSGFWVHRFPLRVKGLKSFLEPVNLEP
jgi:hypothetical protein